MTLDESYESKSQMADAVHATLTRCTSEYGIQIVKVLVVDLQPDAKVLRSMNDIETSKRSRAAAQELAEAQKILQVKSAEADMEAQHLSGQGIAAMRKAITNGFSESISGMQESVGVDPKDVVHMMLVTQYLDTLKDCAVSGKGAVMVEEPDCTGAQR